MHKIVLVDDHKLFRDGLKLLLNKTGKTEVVAEASNGKELLEIIENFTDAIVFMDIQMPEMNGIEATKEVLSVYPELKIIALTMFGEDEYYYQMIEAGVKGFLLKDTNMDEVMEAIELVAGGENCFSKELLYHIVRNLSQTKKTDYTDPNLSDREVEILQLICEGLSNHEIAEKLFISKRTVDKHRSNILDKTGTNNTASLVMYSIKQGIIKI
ncbi:MAG: response regulator transcription factor [Bacteroidetes bacterium]|jgi:DNA-binding NarL/FixJ family response regulator|nr:response regulator transcription factor [Bacteroidota bacterium]